MTLRMLYCTTDNGPKMGGVFWVGKIKKLALHQSFQERDLQSDVQMLKSIPIQVPDVTPSAKLITRQVA